MNIDIKKRAMLVTLSVSYWTGKAADERVIDEVTLKHKTQRDAHEYRKILIEPAALNLVKAVRSRARVYHFEKTMPWIDGGTRVLPAGFYFDYTEKMREFHNEYDAEVVKFIRAYPTLQNEAKKRLGNLFRVEDYPTTERLRRKFGWNQGVLPIPDKDDFRVDLGKAAEADIRKQIDAEVTEALTVATRDLWQRLFDAVKNLADKMKEAEPIFRDSIVHNIRELVAILPSMNISGDPKLEAMRKTVDAELGKVSLDDLRDDRKSRKKTADAADKILAAMSAYVGNQS